MVMPGSVMGSSCPRSCCRCSRARTPSGLGDSPGGIDQSDMAERLREVAEQFAGGGVDLLGEQADIVDERRRLREDALGPLDLPGHRKRLSQPERAQQERALLAGQPVDALR